MAKPTGMPKTEQDQQQGDNADDADRARLKSCSPCAGPNNLMRSVSKTRAKHKAPQGHGIGKRVIDNPEGFRDFAGLTKGGRFDRELPGGEDEKYTYRP